MTSTVTGSKRAALGCGGMRDSHHGSNLQQLRDAIMIQVPKSLRNVSRTLLNLCH